jgi:ribonuclease HII
MLGPTDLPTGSGTLGLDEAGRGSVLGPLVVGAFLLPDSDPKGEARLRDLGVRDSKRLTPKRREEVFASLTAVGRCATARAEPVLVDRHVEHGGLNRLELSLMARLVVDLCPRWVCVDACDVDAARFGRRLKDLVAASGWKGRVLSSHRADERLPVVSAASIVAKVVRDRALAEIQRRAPEPLGSGYPSDPVTRGYLTGCLARGGPLPRWVRGTWATLDRIKRGPRVPTLESFP